MTDAELLAQWFTNHYQVLYNFLCKVSGDFQLSEDLVHETYMRAFLKLHLYKPECGTLETWLLRIAINLYKDHLRWTCKEQKLYHQLCYEIKSAQEDANDDTEAIADPELLEQALPKLPAEKRIILTLAMQHKTEDIAQILSIPVGTVKSRLYHARKCLARLLLGN